MVLDLIMDKGSVKEKEWNLKSTSLDLVPFDHGPTDVVSTDKKIWFGEFSQGAPASQGGPNVREGIRAEIAGITLVFGCLTERYRHPRGSAHGSVIFRIKRKDPHGVEGFHRSAACDPGHLLAKPGRPLRYQIIGSHEAAISGRRIYFAVRINLDLVLCH
jgi:hypothetical protein